MGRMARPGQHNREMQLFYRTSPSGGFAKHGAEFEEADVTLSHAPVVLDATDQAGQQPAAQMGFFGGERVQDRHGVGAVGGTKREGPSLEEAAPARHELLPDA